MPRPFKNQPYRQPVTDDEAHYLSIESRDQEEDIDVCECCGRYYSGSKLLTKKWREKYNPSSNEVMPQRCYGCI